MMEQGRLHLGQCGYSAVLVVAGLLYLLLEHNTTPTLLDDVVYRFQFTATGGLPPEPIQNLGDVLRSQYWHYLTINGRAPAHVLAQTFLTLVPGQVLNVLNALLFMLLIDGGVRLIAPPKQGRVACAALLAEQSSSCYGASRGRCYGSWARSTTFGRSFSISSFYSH